MQTTNHISEKRLQSIAQEYRDQGYSVLTAPHQVDLPPFLQDFHIDLIADNGDEKVVVEIRTTEALRQDATLSRLADVVNEKLGWRLDLIVTGPRNGAKSQATGPLLNQSQMLDRLNLVTTLTDRQQYDAALLLLWSAAESILRSIAKQEKVRLQSEPPAYIVKQLYSLGLLDKEDYDALEDAVPLRNAIVHGFQPKQLGTTQVTHLLKTVRKLIQSSEMAAEPAKTDL